MRKYVIGGLIGAALMLSFNVSAAVESLIGKEVQGEVNVKLNGSDLSNKAAIVDGTSYLPVRSIGEALGLNVDYQNNEVILNKPKEVTPTVSGTTTTPKTKVMTPEEKSQRLKEIDEAIKNYRQTMEINNTRATNPQSEQILKANNNIEANIADLEKQKAELQP